MYIYTKEPDRGDTSAWGGSIAVTLSPLNIANEIILFPSMTRNKLRRSITVKIYDTERINIGLKLLKRSRSTQVDKILILNFDIPLVNIL